MFWYLFDLTPAFAVSLRCASYSPAVYDIWWYSSTSSTFEELLHSYYLLAHFMLSNKIVCCGLLFEHCSHANIRVILHTAFCHAITTQFNFSQKNCQMKSHVSKIRNLRDRMVSASKQTCRVSASSIFIVCEYFTEFIQLCRRRCGLWTCIRGAGRKNGAVSANVSSFWGFWLVSGAICHRKTIVVSFGCWKVVVVAGS
jgi:hypothetical protein